MDYGNERISLPRRLMRFLCFVLPITILAIIWLPVVRHYYVPNVVITDNMLEEARSIPEDAVFDEVRILFASEGANADQQRLINKAEGILRNEIIIPDTPSQKLTLPCHADDINKGPIEGQLYLTSMKMPELLLKAYEITGRDVFLIKAKDIIVAWAEYERTAWLPRGLLWNDGAITARIPVLARFWRLYRNSEHYEPEVSPGRSSYGCAER